MHIDAGTYGKISDDNNLIATVLAFNFCSSLPDICQCLAVQTTQDSMSKNKPSISMTYVACELQLRSVVRSSMPRKLLGKQACGPVLCWVPMHLVQELNVCTVHTA